MVTVEPTSVKTGKSSSNIVVIMGWINSTHKNIGIIYEISNAIAVNENIAFAATGLAKSSRPGKMLKSVVAQMAFMGVRVDG